MKFQKWFLLMAFFATSCHSDNNSSQSFYHGFINNAWETSQTVSFPIEVLDTSLLYTVSAKLRYNDNFTFSTLDMSVSLLTPSGSSRFKKIHLVMRNKDGEKTGTIREGFIELPFNIYDSLRFNEVGKYEMKFNHNMPIDINQGMSGMEVLIETGKQ